MGYFWIDEILEAIAIVSQDKGARKVLAKEEIIETVMLVLDQYVRELGGEDSAAFFWNVYPNRSRTEEQTRRTGLVAACSVLSRLVLEEEVCAWLQENLTRIEPVLRAILSSEKDSLVRSQLLSVLSTLDPEDPHMKQAFEEAIAKGSTKWNKSQIFLVGKGRCVKYENMIYIEHVYIYAVHCFQKPMATESLRHVLLVGF